MRKKRRLLIKNIILLAILIFLTLGSLIYFLLNFNFAEFVINFSNKYYELFGDVGVYVTIFIISVISNFTIVVPIPYTLSVLSVALVLPINPVIFGIFAGAGAAIGETSAWFLGKGTKHIIEKQKQLSVSKNLNLLKDLIMRGFEFPLIILFAATPLPDDLLLILLGMTNYPLHLMLLASLIGKIILTVGLSLFAVLSKTFPLGVFILNLYGFNIIDGVIMSSENTLFSNISILVTLFGLYLFFFIDWTKLFKKKQ
jgi:membrane protein YqaA with SNARE-associated domain